MRRRGIVKLLTDVAKITHAKALRRKLFQKCGTGAEFVGDEIAGFALVIWDRNGDLWTSYDAQTGIVGPALMPTLVHDALNRHVAVAIAAQRDATENG